MNRCASCLPPEHAFFFGKRRRMYGSVQFREIPTMVMTRKNTQQAVQTTPKVNISAIGISARPAR